MYFKTPCDNCTQSSKCIIMKKIRELADRSPYSELQCMVEVDCDMYLYKDAMLKVGTGCGCANCIDISTSNAKLVTNCKDECGFYKYCSSPVDFKTFNKYVSCIQDIHALPVKLNARCSCKLTGDEYGK